MLDPMSPEEAVTEYLEDRRTDLAPSSHENHTYRCQRFIEWADQYGLTNMNDLTGRKLHEFRKWRQEDVNAVTLKTQLGTIRLFLRFCERLNAVPADMDQKLSLPTIGYNEDVNDDVLTAEEATAILDYCETYEYATLRHTAFYLIWHTGMRSGTIRSLDLNDYYSEDRYIAVQHRPETGTPLKNKTASEREVTLKAELCDVLDDFIDHHHGMVEDDTGRMPLLGTDTGRMHKTTLQRNIYTLTRPCHYTNQCPHNRDTEECEALRYNTASKCPTSVSPHALRRGAVTTHRNANVPKEVTGDRMDMTGDVLDKHYDKGTESAKRHRRREFLDGI